MIKANVTRAKISLECEGNSATVMAELGVIFLSVARRVAEEEGLSLKEVMGYGLDMIEYSMDELF